ncbi:TatD family hydrolase [Lentibacillus saliphilus]|uniref:TatD family hydrolase n=1 Tax=Lentibacillus saliphilus TaxID=2737028 RepID=UPI001C2FE691|nr:TatD family hydrolase [Lentibacillus saliphilus]
MTKRLIDAHIHLDMYENEERQAILNDLEKAQVDALIAVSNHLASSRQILKLAQSDNRIKPAIGYHPEQALPNELELNALMELIDSRLRDIVAIGEVGLPYYLRQDNPDLDLQGYIDVLERFVQKAAACDKPVVLHAIYEDADVTCDLMENYGITKAHFHWFKGEDHIVQRLIKNGYVISVTPDVVYENEIQHIVKEMPLKQILVETDGPWPFTGPFEESMTHPDMMHQSIKAIAALKHIDVIDAYEQIYENTCQFYHL